MSVATASKGTPSKRRGGGSKGSPLAAWLFVAPYLVLFLAFVVIPAGYGLWISLHDWDFALDYRPFLGLQNYRDLFDPLSVNSQPFWNSMKNTGIFTILSVPFLLTVPLALALVLHRSFPGRTFFRAMFFAPFVMGVAVIGVMWRYLLQSDFGLVNRILGVKINWTTSQPWAWIALVAVTVWWTVGFNAIIYLAGLGDIPTDHYEAASLDGASPWQKFRYITMPGLRPVFIFILITTTLASANMFGQSYLITNGGPTESTRTAIMEMTQLGFGQSRAGMAAAESYVLAFFLMIISVINFFLTRDRDAARERKEAKAAMKARKAAAAVDGGVA